MRKVKPAGLRPLKSNEKLRPIDAASWKQRPSKIALLMAAMNFVGGLGRVLNAVEKLWKWWSEGGGGNS